MSDDKRLRVQQRSPRPIWWSSVNVLLVARVRRGVPAMPIYHLIFHDLFARAGIPSRFRKYPRFSIPVLRATRLDLPTYIHLSTRLVSVNARSPDPLRSMVAISRQADLFVLWVGSRAPHPKSHYLALIFCIFYHP